MQMVDIIKCFYQIDILKINPELVRADGGCIFSITKRSVYWRGRSCWSVEFSNFDIANSIFGECSFTSVLTFLYVEIA